MRKLSLALFALGLAALPMTAQDLPDGPGKDTFAKVCSACHGLDIIVTLKHSKEEWKTVVDTMASYGASAKDEEFDAIVGYLAKNFGNAPPAAAAATASAQPHGVPDGPGKDTFVKVCSACHGLDIIVALQHTKEEWKTVVDTMASYGASAKDEEFDAIVGYLAKNFGKGDAPADSKSK
jgi:cytochrome c5